MKKTVYFCLILTVMLVNTPKGDTTFVHVVDFQNSRFSSDIELAIEYKDRKLNLFSRSRTVGEIFKELEKKGKIEIKVDEETAQKKVSIFVSGKTLKEGIEAVLNTIGQRDLAISYKEVTSHTSQVTSKTHDTSHTTQYEINKVEIRKRSKAEMEKIEEEEQRKADEEARQRDKEYHELFARMAKEKNKVAKALSDFSNPKASQKQKTQVMTYLRQATIEPEDKPLLRKVLWDPKYEELRGAIAMGLIHAIADNPENSDKEFLLELLKKKKIDFLMYAMKFTWDDRFVPELIDVVKDATRANVTRSTAAEILGFHKVKEAVPALEEALLTCENCTSILVALREITGMNYRVKNGKAEPTHEEPKLAPELLREREMFDKMIQNGKKKEKNK